MRGPLGIFHGCVEEKKSKSVVQCNRIGPSEYYERLARVVARTKLQRCFRCFSETIGEAPKDFPCDKALSILKSHPELAKEDFRNGRRQPLSFFIEAQVELETVATVCELNRDYYKQLSDSNQFPFIAEACMFGAKRGVIEYLTEHYPGGVQTIHKHQVPAQLMLRGIRGRCAWRTKKEVTRLLSVLFSKCPTALVKKERDWSDSLLEQALLGEYGSQLSQFICSQVAELQPRCANVSISNYDMLRNNVRLDVECAARMSMVLPKLRELRCCPASWEDQGLLRLIFELQHQFRGTHLQLGKLPAHLFFAGSAGSVGLQMAVNANHWLENVCFAVIGAAKTGDGSNCSGLLSDIVMSTKNLKRLNISGIVLSSVDPLYRLIAEWKPVRLDVKVWHVHGEMIVVSFKASSESGICDCEMLRMPIRGFENLLRSMHKISTLKEFRMDQHPMSIPLDMTKALKKLLKEGQLVQLSLQGGANVDWKVLIDALEDDKKLTWLAITLGPQDESAVYSSLVRVLECSNTSLKGAAIWVKDHLTTRLLSDENEVIWYYKTLNLCGRAETRNEGISLASFVQLLWKLTFFKCEFKQQRLQFGLLREVPSLWAGSI